MVGANYIKRQSVYSRFLESDDQIYKDLAVILHQY